MNTSKYFELLQFAMKVDHNNEDSRQEAMDNLHEAMMLLDAEDNRVATFVGSPQPVDMQDFASKLLGMG